MTGSGCAFEIKPYINMYIHISHDLGAVTIFRFSELGLGLGLGLRLGLGFRLRLGIGLGLGLGLILGFWLGL